MRRGSMNKIARVLISSLEVLFLLVLIIFNINNVSAADEINIVNDFSYKIVNGEATITGPIGSGIITEIPSEIDGYPVTEIGSEAFLSNTCYYKDLIIPEGVRKIGYAAFCYEGELFNPETIKSRGYNITIPKSVTEINVEAIGYHRFQRLVYLEELDVYITDYLYVKPYKVVIRGYKGTAAETYALQNGFTFIALDDEPVTTTTPVTTDITTTETTVVTTQTTAVSNTATSSSVSTTSIAETTPVTTTVTIPEIKGDANGDGKLAASDAAFIAKELAQSSISGEKITAEDYPSMDFNQDGKVTAKDVADIVRYLAEQSTT